MAMGLMFGLINLVLPMMIGSRDVAFPFMNLTSFWLFAAGMILINLSLVLVNFRQLVGWHIHRYQSCASALGLVLITGYGACRLLELVVCCRVLTSL